jgi:D-3-phosphoglycerate dehydrogenase / 2-oxoglutarate reductase
VTDYTFRDDLAVEKAILEPLGCTVVGAQCRTEQDVVALVRDADFVLTQFAPITAPSIQAMDKVRLITRYGIGVDNIDLDAARDRCIPVHNVPDYCIAEVADHTLGLILALTRQIVRLSSGVKAGGWTSPPPLQSFHALNELTVGVVGCGRIGRAVMARLRPFGPQILAHDPGLSADQITALGGQPVALDDLFARSDLITLHCPSTAQTRHLINAHSLACMKDGVLLVNVARGALVDQNALIAALRGGKVAGAGLDVTDPEPIEADSPLLAMDSVVITSHIASASPRAAAALRQSVAETVVLSLRGERVPNCVNGVTS